MFTPQAAPFSEAFDEWLRNTMQLAPEQRNQSLMRWSEAPAARIAHPREEHLLPLMVIAGAAESDRATTAFNGTVSKLRLSAYHFG